MTELPDTLRSLIESGPLAHLSTVDPDGRPQVTVIWIGLDGDDIVSGHMNQSRKVKNVQRDPRAVLSFLAPPTPGEFLAPYAVIGTSVTVEDGGAWPLLDRLTKVYLGADETFPAPQADGGYVLRYRVERIGGVGPWAGG